MPGVYNKARPRPAGPGVKLTSVKLTGEIKRTRAATSGGLMPIIQRPYVPPDDKVPSDESYVNPGVSQSEGTGEGNAPQEGSLDPITFYSDSMHIFSSLYSAVLFFGEQMEEREPILRARIKVSPQMLKAIALLTTKHVKEYEDAVGPITLPDQVYTAWELDTPDGTAKGEHGHAAG